VVRLPAQAGASLERGEEAAEPRRATSPALRSA
jgi:hypothetical protein